MRPCAVPFAPHSRTNNASRTSGIVDNQARQLPNYSSSLPSSPTLLSHPGAVPVAKAKLAFSDRGHLFVYLCFSSLLYRLRGTRFCLPQFPSAAFFFFFLIHWARDRLVPRCISGLLKCDRRRPAESSWRLFAPCLSILQHSRGRRRTIEHPCPATAVFWHHIAAALAARHTAFATASSTSLNISCRLTGVAGWTQPPSRGILYRKNSDRSNPLSI